MAKKKKKKFNFETLRADIRDRYGESVLIDGLGRVTAIPTGILPIDISTGIGGIPLGRFTQIWGIKGLGKTTVTLHLIKECLIRGGKVAFIDMENTTPLEYFKFVLGDSTFDLFEHNLFRLTPSTTEDGLKIAEDFIRSNEFDLIVYDSLAGSASEKVHEKELEDHHVGLLARLMSQFMPRNSKLLVDTRTAFVFINQVRADIKSRFGGIKYPGGNALEHGLSLEICLTYGKFEKKEKKGLDNKTSKEIVGREVSFEIKKNKVAVPFKGGSFFFDYEQKIGKIDVTRSALVYAIKFGVCSQKGSFYYYIDQDTGEQLKLGQGMKKAIAYLKEDRELLDKIGKLCYNKVKVEMPIVFDKRAEEVKQDGQQKEIDN